MINYTKNDIEKKIKNGESLEGADLKGLNFQGVDCRNGKFKGANLRYTNLSEANLTGADLTECNLRHATFTNSILIDTDVSNSDLTHADFSGAIVIRLNYKGAKMENIKGVSKKKFFFTQPLLDDLFEKGKASFEKDILTVKGTKNETFRMMPAYKVVDIEAGEDTKKLMGKVKTQKELEEIGLEIYMDTAILGDDVVYKLELGVIGIKIDSSKQSATVTETTEKEPKSDKPIKEETVQNMEDTVRNMEKVIKDDKQKVQKSEDMLSMLTNYFNDKME